MNYLARESLFRFAPFRWLIRSLDAIPIDRDGLGLTGIKESLRRLKRGEMVLIFPEGTRTSNGEIGQFRPGFTVLAARSNAWILPVAIEGAYAAWPKSQKLPGLGTIHVHFGEPIPPEQVAAQDERDLIAEVERRVRECHAHLCRHPSRSERRPPLSE
jgi:1-acyl-sn-glycerol-3-phosphate acyltransferase